MRRRRCALLITTSQLVTVTTVAEATQLELRIPPVAGVSAALNGRMISVEPIARLASHEIRTRALADIVAGRAGSCLGITEPGGGSDVASMRTTARRGTLGVSFEPVHELAAPRSSLHIII